MPLDLDHESGRWVPLVEGDGFFYHDIDAGRICAQDFGGDFARVAELARLLRVCCEHPEFRFSGDGIDSEMIKKMARELSYLVMVASDSIERLLDEPSEEDVIQMGGVLFKVNEVTCFLDPTEDDGGQVLNPDRLFVRHLRMLESRQRPAHRNGPNESPVEQVSAPVQQEGTTDVSDEGDADDGSDEEG